MTQVNDTVRRAVFGNIVRRPRWLRIKIVLKLVRLVAFIIIVEGSVWSLWSDRQVRRLCRII